MHSVEDGVKQGWTILVDGSVVNARQVVIENPAFGRLSYGQSPAGKFDAWAWEQLAAGAIIVPYTRDEDGAIWVGVVEQNRPHQGGKILNLPRGFASAGESPLTTANREFAEEVGVLEQSIAFVAFEAHGYNGNNAFFDTRREQGDRFYFLEIPWAALERSDGNELRFRSGVLVPESENDKLKKSGELITKSLFIRASEAARLSDGFTRSGVGALAAHLNLI